MWERRRAQLAENLAREGLNQRELAWGIIDARCVMLSERLATNGTPAPAEILEIADRRQRLQALMDWRAEHAQQIGAPLTDVVAELGLSLSKGRTKQLLAAYTVLDDDMVADLDRLGANTENRYQFAMLANSGGPAAARELMDVILSAEEPSDIVAAALREARDGVTPDKVLAAIGRRQDQARSARLAKMRRVTDDTFDPTTLIAALDEFNAAARDRIGIPPADRARLLAAIGEARQHTLNDVSATLEQLTA